MTGEIPQEMLRLGPYMALMQPGQKVALYPAAEGIGHNDFEVVEFNGSHLQIKSSVLSEKLYVPYSMIEFVSPGVGGSIIRLVRKMKYEPTQRALL